MVYCKQGGPCQVERLPANCRATHVVKVSGFLDVMPIKFILEPKVIWSLADSQYSGFLLLWITSCDKCLLIQSDMLLTGQIRLSALRMKYAQSIIAAKDISHMLFTAFHSHPLVAIPEVLRFTKYEVLPRRQILELRPSTSALEAAAHEELEALLGSEVMHFTPEKCTADWAYGQDINRLLGQQTKSCTMQPTSGQMNIFHNTAGYDGLVLCCTSAL